MKGLVSPHNRTLDVVVSRLSDPARNLSAERLLFDRVEAGCEQNFLFFYVNRPCLVKGKTRSPLYGWFDEELARALGVEVYERMTGGGVVYHDYGNLNWCFVFHPRGVMLSPKQVFEEGSKHIVAALRALSVDARFTPPNRIDVDGHKVSGMAAYSSLGALIVHGTLLVRSDLGTLAKLCVPPKDCPPVANISQYVDVDFSDVEEAVVQSLSTCGFEVRRNAEADL